MTVPGRILAVARIRLLEAIRGPLTGFLVLFLALAVAAALLLPGEPGPGRQRALDGLVLDALLLVTALAAAALGAASLPGDRDDGRESLVAASPLRLPELLVGGFLGHLAALALLLVGGFAGFLAITGFLAGGDADRSPTRVPVRAVRLLDGTGAEAGGPVVLTNAAPAATFVLPVADLASAAGPDGRVRGFADLIELPDLEAGIPDTYEVLVILDGTRVQRLVAHRGQPLEFALDPSFTDPDRPVEVTIRRVDPTLALAVSPGGLLVEGPARSFLDNVGRSATAWLLGLAVIAAAAAALSAAVGAPVAVAGTLLFALLGRSLATLGEAAGHLRSGGTALARVADFLNAFVGVWPDFDAFDRTRLVTARWAIPAGDVLGRLPAALTATTVLLVLAWAVLTIRRRG